MSVVAMVGSMIGRSRRRRGSRRTTHLARTAALAALTAVTLAGCIDLINPDLHGPVIGAAIEDGSLFVDVTDLEGEVRLVEIEIGSRIAASYNSGFRSIVHDLRLLGYGEFRVVISATDTAGNRSSRTLVYDNDPYEVSTRVLARRYESIFNQYGATIGQLEAVHRVTSYEPRNGAPPRPDEHEHSYLLHNWTGFWLYSVSATVTARDPSGTIVWTHHLTTGQIAPGGSITSGVVSTAPVTPSGYTISMSYYF